MNLDELLSQLQKIRNKRGNIPIYTPHLGVGIMLQGVNVYVKVNNENTDEMDDPRGVYCVISQ